MPLRNFFLNQQSKLLDFLSCENRSVCLLAHADDIRQLVNKSLLALDDDESHAHVLLYSDFKWKTEDDFYEHLIGMLDEQISVYRAELSGVGIDLPDLPTTTTGNPLVRLIARADALLHRIPSEDCTLAFVCAWDAEEDVSLASQLLLNFVDHVGKTRLKLIVFDRFPKPRYSHLTKHEPRIGIQEFHLHMDEVEKKVNWTLANEPISGVDRIRYLGMSGAFAAAHRRYDEAEARQEEILKLVGETSSPADEAMAHYNLGNTHLNRQRLEEAESQFGLAAQVCLEHKMNPLLAMVLTNLGITLHRQGRLEESLQCLDISRRTFGALDNRPGEAYALDCKANILGIENQIDAAERTWREALACYDSISNPLMADVRKHGRDDILVKLKSYMNHVGRTEMIRDLLHEKGAI